MDAELAERIDGIAVACDLSDLDRVGSVVPAVVEGLGPPEILVNAAGTMFTTERAESEPLDAVRRTTDLNLLAPFLLAQAVFPHMRAIGRGVIINVSSISGRVGIPGIPQASYAASKAGLSGLSAELAVQWAKHSIRVTRWPPASSAARSPARSTRASAPPSTCAAILHCRRRGPLTTSSAPSCGSRGTREAMSPGRRSSSTAAGPRADHCSIPAKANGYAEIMPSTRRTARQTDLLQRLVALLAAEGFASFTLDELTERLRCSKTTLYQLAGSKQELVREAVKHYFREATQTIEKQVADTSAPADRVVVYLNAVAQQLRPLSRQFLDDMADFEPAREVYEANTRLAAGRLRQLIADGVAAGAFRDVHAAFVGEVVAATMQEIQRGEVAARTGLSDAEAYAELASLIVHAVSP